MIPHHAATRLLTAAVARQPSIRDVIIERSTDDSRTATHVARLFDRVGGPTWTQ